MKNKIISIIVILIVLIPNIVMSQALNMTPGFNNFNSNLDKYVGTWKWEGNGKSFTIILKKENITLTPLDKNVKADILYGFHKYVNNNLTIENSLDFHNTAYSNKKFSISGGLGILGLGNKLKGTIYHISKNNKGVDFIIEYIDSSHIKLVSLKNLQGVKLRLSSEPAYDWSISLPQDIILTRQ